MTKKGKKKLIITLIFIIIILVSGLTTYFLLRDKNKLTILEKQWLSDNANTMTNIGVINNINNFGDSGDGVFFDFINDIEKEYDIYLNKVPYLLGETSSGLSFQIKNEVTKSDLIFFKDHFVLVSTGMKLVRNENDLNNNIIGVLSSNTFVKNYIDNNLVIFNEYNTKDELVAALNSSEIQYMVVPLNEYINTILSSGYVINYHFSDAKLYYTLYLDGDKKLTSSIKKFYNKWIINSFNNYYNEANLNTFATNLKITEKDKDILTRKEYKYGFLENSPYETNVGGNYGGIIAAYLKSFSDLTHTDFKFIKYNKYNKLSKAINNNSIDLYAEYYVFENDFTKTNSINYIELSLITKSNNYEVYNSINSLKGKEVYVLSNSVTSNYLTQIGNINIKYYNSEKELLKLAKKDVLIALDTNTYNYYINNGINNTEQFRTILPISYSFKINGDATFYKLFDQYMRFLDPNEIKNEGVYNFDKTIRNGTIAGKIAKYLLYIIISGIVILYIAYKYSKKVKISKKIKKEDKLKFIDMLTSLKNRNYLNENIDDWDKNTIYPQSIIIIDLNNVKYLNDTFGHEEGDKQIQSAANILIKTQLDNSDIIRSDGNEFLLYLVGYEEKQVVNYMRKLYKEFKKLPYEYGAAIGYSMITDDKKLLDDAINEATIAMRNDKTKEE